MLYTIGIVKGVIKVKKILMIVLIVMFVATACHAVVTDKKATNPISAVVETVGVFIGQISAAIEDSFGAAKDKDYVSVVRETGKTKLFPVDNTVKAIDEGFDLVTCKVFKKYEKVEKAK